MSAIARQRLAESVKADRWHLDVATTPDTEDKGYIGVYGIVEIKPSFAIQREDASDQSHEGSKNEQGVSIEHGIELKLRRAVVEGTPDAYDPGQEALRLAGSTLGRGNRVYVRWFEMEKDGPRVEAYEAWVLVDWEEDGGTSLATVSVSLKGSGPRISIAHPDAPVAG